MSKLHDALAIRPFAVPPGDGEQIWLNGSSLTFKATAESTGGELFLSETMLSPSSGPPLHIHRSEHEAFYVLEGRLEIVCGDERYEAGPGAFAFLPSGIPHTFRTIGAGPARMLTIAVPGGLEGFFRDAGRPAEGDGLPPAGPPDFARLGRASARYGHELVGPPLGA